MCVWFVCETLTHDYQSRPTPRMSRRRYFTSKSSMPTSPVRVLQCHSFRFELHSGFALKHTGMPCCVRTPLTCLVPPAVWYGCAAGCGCVACAFVAYEMFNIYVQGRLIGRSTRRCAQRWDGTQAVRLKSFSISPFVSSWCIISCSESTTTVFPS